MIFHDFALHLALYFQRYQNKSPTYDTKPNSDDKSLSDILADH